MLFIKDIIIINNSNIVDYIYKFEGITSNLQNILKNYRFEENFNEGN
jgi:hypothetical protein